MSPGDLALLQPNLQPLFLAQGKMVEFADRNIESVYFPADGMLSVTGDGAKPNGEVEIGIIGWEGMSGLPVVYGSHRSPYQTFVQIAGKCHCMPAGALRAAMETNGTLRELLLKYAQVFMIQAAQTAIANGRAGIQARLARWLLMAQDRSVGDELPLTVEFLVAMLAADARGVGEALLALVHADLIRHDGAIITVTDREGLLERADGYYGVPEAEYRRLLG